MRREGREMLEFPASYEPPNTGCADQHVRPFAICNSLQNNYFLTILTIATIMNVRRAMPISMPIHIQLPLIHPFICILKMRCAEMAQVG
jgi:hypothetical protein